MALALRPRAYEALIRPLLFRLPPEVAQRMADRALKVWPFWKILADFNRFESPLLRTGLPGLGLANPVGLAAGYDKTCSLLPALSALGFGYVTCGTVTLHPRRGNLGTRVVRDPSRGALINSLGFPNQGLESAIERMTLDQGRLGKARIVVSVSGTTVDEIVTCHRRVEPLTHAVEINISSPNTAGLRAFHDADALASLINAVNEGREKPLFVKMPPFPSMDDDRQHHDLILSLTEECAENGVDAVTVANTLPVRDTRLSVRRRGAERHAATGADAAHGVGGARACRRLCRHQRVRGHILGVGRMAGHGRGSEHRPAFDGFRLQRPRSRQ